MKGFTMLPSYHQALRPLPDDMRLALYDGIMDYVFEGKEPEGLSPILSGYFSLLRPNLDASMRHYAASTGNGKKGGRPPKKPDENPAETQDEPDENLMETHEEPGGNREKECEKECEKKKEEECEKEIKGADKPPRARFSPPTLEDVTAYCRERGNNVDPQKFMDHYASNGWRVGRSKMSDWRAAVRVWEGNGLDKTAKKTALPDYSSDEGFEF